MTLSSPADFSQNTPPLPLTSQVDCSVIIVSYNVARLLAACLSSVLASASDQLRLEIIVVDNASADGSARLVAEQFPEVKLIANTANLGFPRACNQGSRVAQGNYLFFLNPDALIQPDTISILLNFMRQHPRAGVVGPLVNYPDGKVQPTRRRFPGKGLGLVESTLWHYHRRSPFKKLGMLGRFTYAGQTITQPEPVDWLVGAAFVVPRPVFTALGGLDDGFFMYSEETDFCYRVRQAGWEVWFVPQAHITHLEGQSASQNLAARTINFWTSKLRYYQKHHGRLFGAFLRVYLLLLFGLEYAAQWLSLQASSKQAVRQAEIARLGLALKSGLKPYRRTPPLATSELSVGLISAEYYPTPGGVGDYTACLADALRQQQVSRALVITGSTNVYAGNTASVLPTANDVVRLVDARREPSFRWGWRMLPAIERQLRLPQLHAIIIEYQTGAYGMHPAINFLPLYLRLKMGGTRPRLAVTAHDLLVPYLFPKAGIVRQWVNRLLLKTADVAIVTNRADYATAKSWGVAPVLVPIGSNIPVFKGDLKTARAKWGISEKFTIGYFGLINRSKGLHTLLEALAILHQQGVPVQLLIIGGETGTTDATNRAYQPEIAQLAAQLAKKLGVPDVIRYTGHLAEEETAEVLASVDVIALPFTDGASFRRGSLLAALSQGTPVVSTYPANITYGDKSQRASHTNNLADVDNSFETTLKYELVMPQLIDQQNVYLVAPENAGQLADALAKVQSNPLQAGKIGAAGAETARYFSWDNIARQVIALFTD